MICPKITQGYLEVLRVIREEEPPRPSARLSSSETLGTHRRDPEDVPARLTRLVARRAGLDCHEVSGEGAIAVLRNGERASPRPRAISEWRCRRRCSPSALYRLRKAMRKHRVAITSVSAFVVLLILAAVTSAVLATKAMRARVQAIAVQIHLAESVEAAELATARLQSRRRPGRAHARPANRACSS